MPVLGNVYPIKIENILYNFYIVFIFLVDWATQEVPMKIYFIEIVGPVFELYTIAFIFLVDWATQEVPMKIYFIEIVGPVFELYTIAMLGSISTNEA